MTEKEFVLKAIVALRTTGKDGKEYKGIHTVFSGFYEAFRLQFPDKNPVEIVDAMANAGEIVKIPAKKGPRIYLPGDVPDAKAPGVVLKKILGE